MQWKWRKSLSIGSVAFRTLTTLENVCTINRNFLEKSPDELWGLVPIIRSHIEFGMDFLWIYWVFEPLHGSQTLISAQSRTCHRSPIIIPWQYDLKTTQTLTQTSTGDLWTLFRDRLSVMFFLKAEIGAKKSEVEEVPPKWSEKIFVSDLVNIILELAAVRISAWLTHNEGRGPCFSEKPT